MVISSQKIDRGEDDAGGGRRRSQVQFSPDQIEASENAKAFPWHARTRPESFDPIQLRTFQPPAGKLLDWWNTRSNLFCCFFPIMRCIGGESLIQAAGDDDVVEEWKRQLEATKYDKKCPDSMKGLWWLKYNHAHEELVTIFSDANFLGTFNEEGTDGYGDWQRPLSTNWSRDYTCFGLILSVANKKEDSSVDGQMNMKDGICTTFNSAGKGVQVVYKVNNNEWWKVHYNGNPGEKGEQEINFMYKWLKVLDKDGNKTEHWDEWKKWVDEPLPHENCGSTWFPCWACCLSNTELTDNMVRPNRRQVVRFKY
mmetsp:Transcript_11435/g.21389  ORF Transcript_11435/g.21389 Transcript_11435/m.21389 type:complete len:311 (+) Transcript_11435:232-1164(+)